MNLHTLSEYHPPMEPYIDVIYADKDILVLNKPSGILTVPGRYEYLSDCLASRAAEKYPTATIVHRLDMETSGVIIMALNKEAHVHISKQFERRKTGKTYIARLFGHLDGEEGTVDEPLICDWPNRPKQMVCYERGKKAVTHWKVLEREKKATRVQFTPITGRSHQLRVHSLVLGHAILGDNLYAEGEAHDGADRLQLHAKTYTLFHPRTGEEVTFEAPEPF
ncbi:RluA family pseudouridine synthase [Kordiimonas laminariae]|uniref:RluA family pseudouridine synthase n=1 Tax=Kordiimonas laminariae TaxID=2917717 RepID=UPI001FF5A99B|nr:RluA family pseudouridine synthase [Kordiimonas laminariae]MCK0070776.1 RluA family pseudouridine synthase [Kordiimonas laminariae]